MFCFIFFFFFVLIFNGMWRDFFFRLEIGNCWDLNDFFFFIWITMLEDFFFLCNRGGKNIPIWPQGKIFNVARVAWNNVEDYCVQDIFIREKFFFFFNMKIIMIRKNGGKKNSEECKVIESGLGRKCKSNVFFFLSFLVDDCSTIWLYFFFSVFYFL